MVEEIICLISIQVTNTEGRCKNTPRPIIVNKQEEKGTKKLKLHE